MHYTRWRNKDGRAPARQGDYKVYNAVAMCHRKRLCTRLALPREVKDIFQKPKDEDSWLKLERFRKALLRIVEGEDVLQLDSAEEADSIARAVRRCTSAFPDEVGLGSSRLPAGCRLQFEGPSMSRSEVASAVAALGSEEGAQLRYLSRPFGTRRAPLADDFCRALFVDNSAEEIASKQCLSPASFLDRMLLCLYDALWLAASDDWTKRGVANMPSAVRRELRSYPGRPLATVL